MNAAIFELMIIGVVVAFCYYVFGLFRMLRNMEVGFLRERWLVARSRRMWFEREHLWTITSIEAEAYQALLLEELGAFELYAMRAPHHARIEDLDGSYTTPLYEQIT